MKLPIDTSVSDKLLAILRAESRPHNLNNRGKFNGMRTKNIERSLRIDASAIHRWKSWSKSTEPKKHEGTAAAPCNT